MFISSFIFHLHEILRPFYFANYIVAVDIVADTMYQIVHVNVSFSHSDFIIILKKEEKKGHTIASRVYYWHRCYFFFFCSGTGAIGVSKRNEWNLLFCSVSSNFSLNCQTKQKKKNKKKKYWAYTSIEYSIQKNVFILIVFGILLTLSCFKINFK